MKQNKSERAIGKSGEDFASFILSKDGYNILCRNYTCHGGEIDIVATIDKYLCFVEVKLRSISSGIRPAEAVDDKKMSRIKTAAEHFLQEFCDNKYISCLEARFDIIEIYTSKGVIKTYNHIKGIN